MRGFERDEGAVRGLPQDPREHERVNPNVADERVEVPQALHL